jgi:exodeoxyribonuclease VII large subunit
VRLPGAETLLASQRQRTDELGERLRRGLGKVLADARGDLAHASAALRPPLLAARVGRSRDRLNAARLDPRLVARPLADARDRLDRLWRIADSLNPDRVLQRGYARVESRSGGSVTTTGDAQREAALTLVFVDGRVDVRVEPNGGDGYSVPRPAQARPSRVVPGQGSLL